MSPRTVTVVGAGIAGLIAARTLVERGFDVQVLERSQITGGQIRGVEIAGHEVDIGAEAIHMAGPQVEALLDSLGLTNQLITSRTTWTWIWTERGLKRLPAGTGPGGPTRILPLARSGVLGPVGVVRAALEPLAPRHPVGPDVSVGALIAQRFGPRVRDRLIDPLLGNLHAGDISNLSLTAATPYRATAVTNIRSLLMGSRKRGRAAGPTYTGSAGFATFTDGLVTLIDALVDDLPSGVHTGVEVRSISTRGPRPRLDLSTGEHIYTDAVVLAVPARSAAAMLDSAPAAGLRDLRAASVATVIAAYPRTAVEALPTFAATGILFPSTSGHFLKAATFLSRKWVHLEDPDVFFVRMSVGWINGEDLSGMDDDTVVDRAASDLRAVTGLDVEPEAIRIQRWPDSMAQLEVGHRQRMDSIRPGLADRNVVLAGAPYDGIGIASCIRSGRSAAMSVSELLGSPNPGPADELQGAHT